MSNQLRIPTFFILLFCVVQISNAQILTDSNLPTTSFAFSQTVHVSPNPVLSQMELRSQYAIGTVRIFSSLGQELVVQTTTANTLDVDVSSFASGVYIIQIQSETGNSFIKFIKQ